MPRYAKTQNGKAISQGLAEEVQWSENPGPSSTIRPRLFGFRAERRRRRSDLSKKRCSIYVATGLPCIKLQQASSPQQDKLLRREKAHARCIEPRGTTDASHAARFLEYVPSCRRERVSVCWYMITQRGGRAGKPHRPQAARRYKDRWACQIITCSEAREGSDPPTLAIECGLHLATNCSLISATLLVVPGDTRLQH